LKGLDSSLAKASIPYNYAPAVILDGACKYLGCRSAHAVYHDNKGAFVLNGWIRIVELGHKSFSSPDLYSWSGCDKETHKLVHLLEGASAVVSKVNDKPVNIFLLKLRNKAFDIPGGAPVIGVSCLGSLEVLVKDRDFDDAKGILFIVDL